MISISTPLTRGIRLTNPGGSSSLHFSCLTDQCILGNYLGCFRTRDRAPYPTPLFSSESAHQSTMLYTAPRGPTSVLKASEHAHDPPPPARTMPACITMRKSPHARRRMQPCPATRRHRLTPVIRHLQCATHVSNIYLPRESPPNTPLARALVLKPPHSSCLPIRHRKPCSPQYYSWSSWR